MTRYPEYYGLGAPSDESVGLSLWVTIRRECWSVVMSHRLTRVSVCRYASQSNESSALSLWVTVRREFRSVVTNHRLTRVPVCHYESPSCSVSHNYMYVGVCVYIYIYICIFSMNVDIFSIRYTIYNRIRKSSLFTPYTETVIPRPSQWNITLLA